VYYKLRTLIFVQNILHNNVLYSLAAQSKKISCGIVSGRNVKITDEFCLHYWDGRKIFQLDSFKFPEVFSGIVEVEEQTNRIPEMQITGRGTHK